MAKYCIVMCKQCNMPIRVKIENGTIVEVYKVCKCYEADHDSI